MAHDKPTTDQLSARIHELGNKSGQVLLFLSFVMVSAATLEAVKGEPIAELKSALWWWKLALFPILLSILPMKEALWNRRWWYSFIRWLRVVLLWIAVTLISIGVYSFLW
jgi:hypothetical protein